MGARIRMNAPKVPISVGAGRKYGSDASSTGRFGRTRTKLGEVQISAPTTRCGKARGSTAGKRGGTFRKRNELAHSEGPASTGRSRAFAPALPQTCDRIETIEAAEVELASCEAASADQLGQATATAPSRAPEADTDDGLRQATSAVAGCTRRTVVAALIG